MARDPKPFTVHTSIRVLVVDNDDCFAVPIIKALDEVGCHVLTARDVHECLDLARNKKPALIILDAKLPSASGFAVCRLLRRESKVPIILMTERPGKFDCMLGAELGADHCFAKPNCTREVILCAKHLLKPLIKAASKSAHTPPIGAEKGITVGELTLYPERYEVSVSGKKISLTPTELSLLHVLAEHPDQLLSPTVLLQHLKEDGIASTPGSLRVKIWALRQKIETDPSAPRYLQTLIGRDGGYRLTG